MRRIMDESGDLLSVGKYNPRFNEILGINID
jgi:hypothetical protein